MRLSLVDHLFIFLDNLQAHYYPRTNPKCMVCGGHTPRMDKDHRGNNRWRCVYCKTLYPRRYDAERF